MSIPHYPPAQQSPEQRPNSEEGVIPLPPAPQAAAAPQAPRVRSHASYLLASLVVVLAFLAASFVARNSDLWFHLATGRLLAHGQFSFGTDPFAYTTLPKVYWANHAWLFDLGLYGLYVLSSGIGLVIVKALLIAALAGLLLSVRRPEGAGWVSAVSTTLAVLAMSPRLLVQPACVSYFFLGLTFWLLWKAGSKHPSADTPNGNRSSLPAAYYLLPVIFALWVNVDEWFFLGPVLAALFWLGERLQGQRRLPGWVVLAGLAACLLNPHTYHAFTLPPALSPVAWTGGLRQDVRFQAQFASPWQAENLRAAAGPNAAALAYFALFGLSVLSFLLHPQALRGWRLVVWLPFALLAAWQAWLIPFFAVIAAPITALNLQDFIARREAGGRLSKPSYDSLTAFVGRSLVGLAILGLIFLTWIGGLAGYAREERHVAWGVQAEPSLQQTAEMLSYWRREGLLLPGERVFALSGEVAQYAAWFSPGERQFFDHRYPLFSDTARDYEAVCRALQPELFATQPRGSTARGERAKDWRQVLKDYDVGIVVFYDRDPQRLFAVLHRLTEDRQHWTILQVAGNALIAGWNEARSPGAFAPLAFDARRLAFGPRDERTQRELPDAPEQGPANLPPPRNFLDRLTPSSPAPPAWESAAASVYLRLFPEAALAEQKQELLSTLGRSYAPSLVGLPAQPSGIYQAVFQLVSSSNLLFKPPQFRVRSEVGPYFAHLADRSPALPLMVVRAARRAVVANPQDANAWLRLGQAYLLLRDFTGERSAEGILLLPPLAQVRHVQIVTALEQAVRLNPDLEEAHHELRFLYGQFNYLDRALEHQKEELRLTRQAGRRPGESTEEFANRLEYLDKDTAKLVELVRDGREKYAADSRSLQGERMSQVNLALQLGLARLAVEEILLNIPADLLGAAGIKMELELLLLLGRTDEVRAILNEKGLRASKQNLRYAELAPPQTPDGRGLYFFSYQWPAYEWLHLLQAAAVGDYAPAREDVRAIRADLHAKHERLRQQHRDFELRVATYLPGYLLSSKLFLADFALRLTEEQVVLELSDLALRGQQADLCVLEGLLAMEEGDTRAARTLFAEALELSSQARNAPAPFAGRPIVADYLGKLHAKD